MRYGPIGIDFVLLQNRKLFRKIEKIMFFFVCFITLKSILKKEQSLVLKLKKLFLLLRNAQNSLRKLLMFF
jgi:hypothetical protein